MGAHIALIGVLTGFTGEVSIPALFTNQIRVSGISVGSRSNQLDMIQAITVNGHQLWGGGAGTLAAGEPADLVIWDGDPLEPSTNATAVLIDGQPTSTDNRQRALELRYLPLARSQ